MCSASIVADRISVATSPSGLERTRAEVPDSIILLERPSTIFYVFGVQGAKLTNQCQTFSVYALQASRQDLGVFPDMLRSSFDFESVL